MSSANGTCEYILDPDDPKTWGGSEDDECYIKKNELNEQGVWSCPHQTDNKYCVFHDSYGTKDTEPSRDVGKSSLEELLDSAKSNETDSLDELKEIINKLNSNSEVGGGGSRRSYIAIPLIGAEFNELNYNEIEIASESNLTLDLRHTTISSIEFIDVTTSQGYDFRGARFTDEVTFRQTRFEGGVNFKGATFSCDVRFYESEFARLANFAETKFCGLADFTDATFEPVSDNYNSIIKFENSIFKGRADFEESNFHLPVSFTECKFVETVTADFRHVTFYKEVYFSKTLFDLQYEADFADATFEGKVCFNSAEFSDTAVDFPRVVFGDDVEFEEVTIDGSSSFDQATFAGQTVFKNVDIGTNMTDFPVDFSKTTFNRQAKFEAVTFRGETQFTKSTFNAEVIFNDTVFGDPGVTFERAEIAEDSDFSDANGEVRFNSPPSFTGAELVGVDFSGTELDGSDFGGADLTDAILKDTLLRGADLETAQLSRANLTGADLRGAALAETVLTDARINDRTQFLQPPVNNLPVEARVPRVLSILLPKFSTTVPTCGYDCAFTPPDNANSTVDWPTTNLDKCKSVYKNIENIAGLSSRPRLQSRALVRRKDIQSIQNRREISCDNKSVISKFGDYIEIMNSTLARWILLYGESPWRIVIWSLGTILLFSLLYPVGGWMQPEGSDPITYGQISANPIEFGNSIYYSTLTFTALGFGDFEPVGLGRALTTIETAVGAVLLALLVFVLGRKAAR